MELLALLIIFVPVLGSLLMIPIGMVSEKLRNLCALMFVLVSLILSFKLLPMVLAGNASVITHQLPFGFNFSLVVDRLSVFMAICSSLIGAIIVFYSFEYINDYENRNEYYFMVVLFLGSMMGIIFSANLILLYVFWEITAIASYRLIGFFREKHIVLKADKSFLVTVFGAVMMSIGFIQIYAQCGSFDYAVINQYSKTNMISNFAIAMVLIGILSKSATLPLHTWLPDAGVAPSPVTALLHAAVLVKIGVYVYARLFLTVFSTDIMWHTIVPVIAGTSAIVSAGAALLDTDIKRIIAFSTISQIGFIFLGLATGNAIGITGGLLYILMHGLAKAGLFLCAGIVEHATHEKNITKLGGLIKTMPFTAAAFLLCSFSVMGIPPFGGFWSKYLVINGSVMTGQFWITATFIFGAFLTLIYLFRVFYMVFLGEAKTESHGEHAAGPMVISVSALAFLSILGGVFINYISTPVLLTVAQMLGK